MAINYEKINWDTTKYINPTNMNTMDTGIKSACDGVDRLDTELGSIIDDTSEAEDKVWSASKSAEEVTTINNKLLYGGKNILDCYGLNTTTVSGVTFTNNNDGTITVNGTSTEAIYFPITSAYTLKSGKSYKLCGCPSGGRWGVYCLYPNGIDTGEGGNGKIYNMTVDKTVAFNINIGANVTCNNLIFKPMLSEDLTVSYDNFEPFYNGVMELTNKIDNKVNLPQKNVSFRGYVTFGKGTSGNQCYSSMIPLPNANNYTITLTDVHKPWYADHYESGLSIMKGDMGFLVYANNATTANAVSGECIEVNYKLS